MAAAVSLADSWAGVDWGAVAASEARPQAREGARQERVGAARLEGVATGRRGGLRAMAAGAMAGVTARATAAGVAGAWATVAIRVAGWEAVASAEGSRLGPCTSRP